MTRVKEIALDRIRPGDNDRTIFDETSLQELAASIKDHGLIEPIIVQNNEYFYVIVAGERRFRACRLAGLKTVPAIIRAVDDQEASIIMLTENLNRKNLDPVDEAMAYRKRMDQFGWSLEDLCHHVKVSQVHVRFRLKLLKLIPEIQKLVRSGNMSIGYGQILADADLDSNFQILAFSKFRDNSKPTPGWFRSIVLEIKAKQDQGVLFKGPLFDGVFDTPDHQGKEIPEPPHPANTIPPRIGKNLSEIIQNQKGFWEDAAGKWKILGKPFKKQECETAAQALSLLVIGN